MPLSRAEQDEIRHGAERFSLRPTEEQGAALMRYLDLLMQWRAHARLVSQHQTRSDLVRKHLTDAFAAVRHLSGCRRIADIGSGAGLPGLPIAVLCPDVRIALIEPNLRKANFLREVIRQLKLANAVVVEARVQDVAADIGEFDGVISRAVWALPEFLERVGCLIAFGGLVIAMKGPGVDEELVATDLAAAGFSLQGVDRYHLQSGEGRALVLLRRNVSRETPSHRRKPVVRVRDG
ncbi:MAG: 16S rRNA (guanine(527)-N(7))-methyltransferase RsmG [Deltaproteobacteria bacterium]|nr:16S rRNA (guanine(527)-N(7))-methyltransferase RsmG [Deltaproteobacteria bacterium]